MLLLLMLSLAKADPKATSSKMMGDNPTMCQKEETQKYCVNTVNKNTIYFHLNLSSYFSGFQNTLLTPLLLDLLSFTMSYVYVYFSMRELLDGKNHIVDIGATKTLLP